MPVSRDHIAANLERIQFRIAQAAARVDRSADDIQVVAVTKTVGVEEIQTLQNLGIRHFGENRVDGARPKIESLGGAVTWHMIGHIQRRKAGQVIDLFSHVDSVDRLDLAQALQRKCDEADRSIEVLVEVNVSGEEQKHGFPPAAVSEALRRIQDLDRLRVRGLLTMAPFDAPEPVLRSVFAGLRQLADDHGLATRSMGMSDDFEIAIEEGSTEVRIGTALFKEPED